MKNKDILSLGKVELEEKLDELRKELIKMNAEVATGTTPKNPGQIKESKRTIARILTQKKNKDKTKQEAKSTAKKEEPKEEQK